MRIRYQLTSVYGLRRLGIRSGLPFDFQGTEEQALAEYGPSVVDRINISSGRIKPTLFG